MLMPRIHGCRGAAYSPKNLTKDQSKTPPKHKLAVVETMLSDTVICLLRLAIKLNIDLLKTAENKTGINEQESPVDKADGNAKKYTELGD